MHQFYLNKTERKMNALCLLPLVSHGFPLHHWPLLRLFAGAPHLPQSSVPRLLSTLLTLHFSLCLQNLVQRSLTIAVGEQIRKGNRTLKYLQGQMSSGDYKLNSVVVESPSPVQTLPDIMDLKYSRLVPVPHHLLEFAQVLS